MTEKKEPQSILEAPLAVVSLGVELFVEPLVEQGVPVLTVDWRPPSAERWKAYTLLPWLED